METKISNEVEIGNLQQGAVIRWVAASEELPPLYRLGMSRDVLTIAGTKMSVKSYDYELGRWNGSPHITVKYWMELPEPPCV
jgi:hypothetical protein